MLRAWLGETDSLRDLSVPASCFLSFVVVFNFIYVRGREGEITFPVPLAGALT